VSSTAKRHVSLDARAASRIRHRLRALQLKHWKNESTVYRELRDRGLSERKADKVARNTRSWWRNSGLEIGIALPASHFDNLGVPRLAG
jgi:RNA-directed DNA polymerase